MSEGAMDPKKQWIMISGPYTSGGASTEQRAANLLAMNEAAREVLSKGHIPIIGVNMALPIIEAAGPESFTEIMMPVSLELARRCDAVLRIGGPSVGADQEVDLIEANGGQVYASVAEIPDLS
ncbi:MAG: hypothetical protein Phyf2KO_00640 [Phycisphaerales bacterium]